MNLMYSNSKTDLLNRNPATPKKEELQEKKEGRKKSEIVWSSPLKNNIQAEADDMKKKFKLNPQADLKRKKTEVESTIFYQECTRVYTDLPFEDWVTCKKCEEWWHEDALLTEAVASTFVTIA